MNQAIETEDVVDLEECAKARRRPPHALRYRIRIDRDYYVVEKHTITGRELLILAQKTPVEGFAVHQKLHGGQMVEIGLDQSVDLREPGIERFVTMERKLTDGAAVATVTLRRIFHLPEADCDYLEALGLPWETIKDQDANWVLIHEHPVSAGFNQKLTTLAIRIDLGYPPAKLDMFYVFPALSRSDGRSVPALSLQNLDGAPYQRWSRHYEWREGVDSLATHHRRIVACLEEELKRT